MEQQILVDPVKLTPAQVNDRAQKLVAALGERDLLTLEMKHATQTAKEAIAELDVVIGQLRGEIRESRMTPPIALETALYPRFTNLDTPKEIDERLDQAGGEVPE